MRLPVKKDEITFKETISITIYGPFTIVEVEGTILRGERTIKRFGVGISKRSPLDRFDNARGVNIAEGRAKKAVLKKFNNEVIYDKYMG